MRDDLFETPEFGVGSEEMLMKALSAGYGTDAAQFSGGRALQPEDCETTLVNAMREQQEDFKMMNTIKKQTVKSTVHQFNMRTNAGGEDDGFVDEGGIAPDNNQAIARVTKDMKYIQKRGEVTEQAVVVDTYENAFDAEKIACTLSVLKTAEKACFHGDSTVIPIQFDGLIAQVKRAPIAKRNVLDLRGQSIQTYGEKIFTEMAGMIYEQGGEANKVFYPNILGQDIQDLCRDRLRFGTDDERMTAVFKIYPTLFGNLKIADDAGPDKLFRPKNKIIPGGVTNKLPNKPATVAIVAGAPPANTVSKFTASPNFAGEYTYAVHAVNEYGISEATSAAAPVAVAAGQAVTITIAPAATNPGTGFIITRSGKDGSELMEMVSIGRDVQNSTTAYVDLNEDLPGTAEMLYLTEKKIQTVVEFFQLLPLRLYRMYPTDRLVTPFIMALWGTPAIKVPGWCGVAKNIQYKGGISY